jgi:nitrite reductase/ring-hydroxylating ferredoxin subunit
LFPLYDFGRTTTSQKRSNPYIEDASIFNMVETPRFQKVANKSDLREGGLLGVEIDNKRVVLSMVEGKVYAMNSICSHKGAPLEEGTLFGYDLKCPWHFALFDVRNGKVSARTVWAKDLESYPVQVDQTTGDILINVSSGRSADSAKASDVT